MLVIAPLAVGLIGVVIERLLIRHLYGRMIDTLLATWGLSLLADRPRHDGLRQLPARARGAARQL